MIVGSIDPTQPNIGMKKGGIYYAGKLWYSGKNC